MNKTQQSFMKDAIKLSIENAKSGKGGPFAALVVKNDRMIAQGTNQVTSCNDPTAHAEIVAIRKACEVLNHFQLTGCDMYTTCEPCPMCLGAIYWARPDKIYFANMREDAHHIGFDDAFIYDQLTIAYPHRKIPMIQILRDEALEAFNIWKDKADKIQY